ncbi:MAG TPA: T9SS type A sorting domain-containing protein, partial [Cytophagaceae bacterium]|nr:T9SS type A sorting domain-containing protein [Cytophagaceae bacterium]
VGANGLGTTVTVYPNPVANHQLFMKFTNPVIGKFQVRLFNVLGQLVYTSGITLNSSNYLLLLDNSIMQGCYQLELSNENGETSMSKVIIQ